MELINLKIANEFYNITKDKWFLYLYNYFPDKFNDNYNINEVEIRLNYLKEEQFNKLLYFFRSNSEFNESNNIYTNIIINDTGTRCTVSYDVNKNKIINCIQKTKGNIDYKFDRKLKSKPFLFRVSFANESIVPLEDYSNKNITKRIINRYSFIDSNELFRYDLSKVTTIKSGRIKKDVTYEFEIELLHNGDLITAIKHMLVLSSYMHGYKINDYKIK